MANNFDSNFSRKLSASLLKGFESERNLSKDVNTQLLEGKFDPNSGENTDFKRPTDYKTSRTATGDVSGETASSIITGKATGTVQDYITVFVDFSEADQAIKMGNLDDFMKPMASRIVTDLELDFADYMMKNSGLVSGTVGTAASTWAHIADASATLSATGVPKGDWCYAVNPYTQVALAGDQRGLGGETGSMTANQQATISNSFAGMKVKTATTLSSYTTGTGADRAGTLSANPTVTYTAAKDSMTQSLAVTGFQANLVVAAGEKITIAGRNRLNLSTRQPILDAAGNEILFSGTVTESVTLGASGEGTLVVTGPAIYEAAGQYNTVDSAPISGDVVTLGGAASTLIQPNLFFHKDAFAIGSVPMQKLYSTDTLATTQDGLQLRVSKGVGFLENSNKIRIDLRPAFATLNPFFAGHGFGS